MWNSIYFSLIQNFSFVPFPQSKILSYIFLQSIFDLEFLTLLDDNKIIYVLISIDEYKCFMCKYW